MDTTLSLAVAMDGPVDPAAEALGRVVRCAYRRAHTVLSVPPTETFPPGEEGDSAISDAVLDVVDEARLPNAMRPRGWSMAGEDVERGLRASVRESLSSDRVSLFGRDARFVGSVAPEDYTRLFQGEADDGIVVRHEVGGEEVVVEGSLGSGFAGQAAADPLGFFSGLVRVSRAGDSLVAADAPLSVQAARLSDIIDGWEMDDPEDVASVADHLTHVLILSSAIGKAASDPCAWIDLSKLTAVMEEVLDVERREDGEPVDADGVAMDLLDVMEDARPTDPHWRVGPSCPFAPGDWVTRDSHGAGQTWAHLDATMAAMPWGPAGSRVGNDAAAVVYEIGDGQVLARVRREVVAGELVCAWHGSLVGRRDDLGAYLAMVVGDDRAMLLAWSVEDTAGPRVDPLMAETLLDGPDVPPMSEPRTDAAYAEAMETMADLGIIGVLPSPGVMPDYGVLMLLHAHARGLGVADLAASLAATVREGWADVALRNSDDGDGSGDDEGDEAGKAARRETVAAPAEAFGGSSDLPLMAMLRAIQDGDWGGIDLTRDVRLLGDAMRAGLTLNDLAMAAADALDEFPERRWR